MAFSQPAVVPVGPTQRLRMVDRTTPLDVPQDDHRGHGPRLVCVASSGGSKAYPLDEGEAVLLGRSKEASIVFASMKVSRKHASVVGNMWGWWVRDVRSSSGTFVNDELLIEPWLLSSGDLIRIGDELILFVTD